MSSLISLRNSLRSPNLFDEPSDSPFSNPPERMTTDTSESLSDLAARIDRFALEQLENVEDFDEDTDSVDFGGDLLSRRYLSAVFIHLDDPTSPPQLPILINPMGPQNYLEIERLIRNQSYLKGRPTPSFAESLHAIISPSDRPKTPLIRDDIQNMLQDLQNRASAPIASNEASRHSFEFEKDVLLKLARRLKDIKRKELKARHGKAWIDLEKERQEIIRTKDHQAYEPWRARRDKYRAFIDSSSFDLTRMRMNLDVDKEEYKVWAKGEALIEKQKLMVIANRCQVRKINKYQAPNVLLYGRFENNRAVALDILEEELGGVEERAQALEHLLEIGVQEINQIQQMLESAVTGEKRIFECGDCEQIGALVNVKASLETIGDISKSIGEQIRKMEMSLEAAKDSGSDSFGALYECLGIVELESAR